MSPEGGTTVTSSVPTSLTADGLLFARSYTPFDFRDTRAIDLPVRSLSGASVELRTPAGFEPVASTQMIQLTTENLLVAWTAVSRGWGIWQFQDHPNVELIDVVELDKARVGFYELNEVGIGRGFLTLWQGALHDLTTTSFPSLNAALEHILRLEASETSSGVILRTDGWNVRSETVFVTLAPLADRGVDTDVALEVVPLDPLPDSERLVNGAIGRWGEFWLLGDSVLDGFQFQSSTAAAVGNRWEPDAEDALLEGFGVNWLDPRSTTLLRIE